MRIFVIGFGGAGSRIADTMYAQDRHFSKLSCVEALAVDRDPAILNGLRHLPVEKKVFFPSLSQNTDDISDHITIDEVMTRIHHHDTGDRDAIVICGGAGGTMIDTAIKVIPKIRSSMVDPVFGLFTLPARDEGRRISAKAAYDLERLAPLVDGIFLFDNESWPDLVKRRSSGPKTARPGKETTPRPGVKPVPGKLEVYRGINEGISRRLGLLLRAGEFTDSGGIEIGEVVLDAGEILNTIRGMGFIAIGYSAASLRDDRFSIRRIVRHADYLVETGHKRASRLVDLAKEAIYENISIPCDMTSARKALILVAGPSHEISMKGYMTVRKWIDRSITGMEVRSGDYPVKTTKYLAVIIILAGITNIPRISEINAVLRDYTKEKPDWISDIHKTKVEPVVPDEEPAGRAGRGTLVPRILPKKRPGMKPEDKTRAAKPQETIESVRTIPFFGRHGTSRRQQKESSGMQNNGPAGAGEIPGQSPDTTVARDIPGTVPDEKRSQSGNTSPGKPDERPVRAPEHAPRGQDDDQSANLANIVAKARKDLENVDEK